MVLKSFELKLTQPPLLDIQIIMKLALLSTLFAAVSAFQAPMAAKSCTNSALKAFENEVSLKLVIEAGDTSIVEVNLYIYIY